MDLWKAGLYTALVVGALVVASVVVSLVMALVGLAVSLVVSVVMLFVVLSVLYTLVQGTLWLADGTNQPESGRSETNHDDHLDRLTERYVDGELSEAEFERRLEHELDGPERDDIDRELQRSRSGQ